MGKLMFEADSKIELFLGPDFGIEFSSWHKEYTQGPARDIYEYWIADDWEDSGGNTDLTFHFAGGMMYKFSQFLNGFWETKYSIGGIDHFGIFIGIMRKY